MKSNKNVLSSLISKKRAGSDKLPNVMLKERAGPYVNLCYLSLTGLSLEIIVYVDVPGMI